MVFGHPGWWFGRGIQKLQKLKTMSQNEVIKKHLQQGHRLTPIYALKEFGCFRLASRINDLRNEGMNIKTVKATLPSGKRIAVYHLERDNV